MRLQPGKPGESERKSYCKHPMSEILDASLKKITTGTGIALIGRVVGMLIAFAGRPLLTRCVTIDEYGIYSIAVLVLEISVILSVLGLEQGVTRYIAFLRGKNDTEKIRGTVSSAIKFSLIASFAFSIILALASGIISTKFFHNAELTVALRIFALGIPFLAMIHILRSFFRGFERVGPIVFFGNLLAGILPLFLLFVLFLDLPFLTVLYAHLASIVITFAVFVAYARRKSPVSLKIERRFEPIGKELFLFSLPLLGMSVMNGIGNWAGTFTLGYFKPLEEVGLYNAALPIALLLLIPVQLVTIIYLPVTSQLFSAGFISEMKRTHAVVTKWLFIFALPIFFPMILFPGILLGTVFGSQYSEAALALQILALGFLIRASLGLPGMALISLGKTRFLLWSALIGAVIINIVLNIALVPPLGAAGAAIASAASLSTIMVLNAARLFTLGIHPVTRNYSKALIISFTLVLITYGLTRSLFPVTSLGMLVIVFIAFLAVWATLLLFAKTLDREDIMIILQVEKRLGLNLTRLKKILSRFV